MSPDTRGVTVRIPVKIWSSQVAPPATAPFLATAHCSEQQVQPHPDMPAMLLGVPFIRSNGTLLGVPLAEQVEV